MLASRNAVNQAGRALNSTSRSIEDIFLHYDIPYTITQARGGWISTHCPYCIGSKEDHLGFSLTYFAFKCWRCGKHPPVETIGLLCHIGRDAAYNLYQEIRGGRAPSGTGDKDRKIQARINLSLYKRPSDIGEMRANHRRYLAGRGFDPDRIERDWGVLGTGPISWLDDINFRFRLFIPIYWGGNEVSFQTRDITGKSELKYITCPLDREIKHHKHILYGKQECWGETAIIVEGATDVWRFGPRACATFGITYLPEQVIQIAKQFKRVAIVFDSEPQAQKQARNLQAQLKVRLRSGERPILVNLGDGIDPGSMNQVDADALVRDLTK